MIAGGCAFVALDSTSGWGNIRDPLALSSPKLLDYQILAPRRDHSLVVCSGSHDIMAQQMLLPQYGLI